MNVLVKVTNDIEKWAKEEQARIDKAVVGSLYDATYALYQEAWRGLKMGKLGLKERQVLGNIRGVRKEIKARGTEGVRIKGGKKSPLPLTSLYPGILYKVLKSEKRGQVGFVGSELGASGIQIWAEKMAGTHLPGYTILYNKDFRDKLHGMGVHLKKTTASASVPARDIMGTVNEKHGGMAMEKLEDSFRRKMAGERT